MAAGSTYTLISSQTLGSSASTVTFSSIPSTYTDLVLIASARVTGGQNSDGMDVYCYLNSDSGANYSNTQFYGNGSSASSNRGTNWTAVYAGVSSNGSQNSWPTIVLNINNYANTTTYKTVLSRADSPIAYTTTKVSLWRNTSAINSLTFFPELSLSFVSGSIFSLYGIAAA